MGIIEVIPGAIFGTLTVKGREGSFNGETTWRCEDEKERNVVFLESEIMAMYEAPEKDESEAEAERLEKERIKKEQEEREAKIAEEAAEKEKQEAEEKAKAEAEKKKGFFGGNKKDNKGRK